MTLQDLGKLLFSIFVYFYYVILNGVKFCIPYTHRSKDISKEIILVTGGGSGIGKSLSKKYATLGATVVLWDVDHKSNEQTKKEIEENGGKVFAFKVDLSNKDEIYKVAKQVKEIVGSVTILVNNAGIVTGKNLLDCPDGLIEKTMQVNTMAHFWTCKSFLPDMIEKNHGHIIATASIAGIFGASGLSDYCASKFAVVGFMESLRNELIAKNLDSIKTTVVCPAAINTGLFQGFEMKNVPMLETDYVTDKIVEATLTDQIMLIIPRSMYVLYALRGIMPYGFSDYLSNILESNKAMDKFVGRKKDE